MIVHGWRGMAVGLVAVVLLGVLVLAPSAPAASMLLQPDGKILVLGQTWPAFGSMARLQPDGTLDPGFGLGGFVLDRRLPSFRALSLQPDGRIVGAAVGGFQLARYLPDGTPDPSFAGGGVGGTEETDQPYFLYGGYGPSSVVVQPGGSIVAGGTRSLGAGNSEAWVKRYDADGRLIEAMGHVPQPDGPASSAAIDDLLEGSDGSFYGVGSTYGDDPSKYLTQPFLSRFVPRSGADFDPGFADGAGLARLPLGSGNLSHSTAGALVASGDGLLVAGEREGTFLLARFGRDGVLDSSFGDGGFVAPQISGPGSAPLYPGAPDDATSSADALALTGDGRIVLGGGTSEWSSWSIDKTFGIHCTNCPQPLLARFDASGRLDPSFGSDGLLRLLRPDGSLLEGSVDQIFPLADGKMLVKGSHQGATPFVARLNPDGSYDASFGQDGMTALDFPCADESDAARGSSGCLPSARVAMRLRGRQRGRPALSLRVRPSLPWAAVRSGNLYLPPGLRLTKGFRAKTHVVAVGGAAGGAKLDVFPPTHRHRRGKTTLHFEGFGRAGEVRIDLAPGSLRIVRGLRHRRPAIGLTVDFAIAEWESELNSETVSRRVG